MAIGVGEGAEIRTPMAVAVMGGLTLSTLLTLVLIPVVYEWADRKRYELEDSQQPTSADAAWQAGD
jgi:HAE1 family hydrophobic/amphiphilic exporter-1